MSNGVAEPTTRGGKPTYAPSQDLRRFLEFPTRLEQPRREDGNRRPNQNPLEIALAPRPLRMEDFVDGLNRRVAEDEVRAAFQIASVAYREADASDHLEFTGMISAADWLIRQLRE